MKINATLIFAQYTEQLSYYDDWIDAFKFCDSMSLTLVNAADLQNINKENFKKIEKSELIILHHSMFGDTLEYIKLYKNLLCARTGQLFSFVGNEVNLPILGMAPKIQTLKEIEPEYILTQLLEEAGKWLYSDCFTSQVVSIPHALNLNAFKSRESYSNRKIDIGSRSARYGVYLGDNDRNRIINYFQTIANQKNLNVDLGLDKSTKRFTRYEWANFLNQTKATISTEAGSFYLDKTDKILNGVIEYVRAKRLFSIRSNKLPEEISSIRKLYRKLIPKSLRLFMNNFLLNHLILDEMLLQDRDDFEVILNKFFKVETRAPVYTKCISSRHFDAIGTKTLQILFPGRFNDILIPNLHYVSLLPDFSNIDNVLSVLTDDIKAQKISEEAYQHILKNHTYSNRVDKVVNLFELGYRV